MATLSSGNWDFFIIAFFFLTVFVYGMAIQKGMSIVMIISSYIAAGITFLISTPLKTGSFLSGFIEVQTIFFAASVFVISFILISNGPLLSVVKSETGGAWWEKMLLGLAFSGLFLVTLIYLATPEQQALFAEKTSKQMQNFLYTDTARTGWALFPFFIFFLTNKQSSS